MKSIILGIIFISAAVFAKAQTLDSFYKHQKFGVFYAHQYADRLPDETEIRTGIHSGAPDEIVFKFFYPTVDLFNSRKLGFFFKYENTFIGDGISYLYNERFYTPNSKFGLNIDVDDVPYGNLFLGQINFGVNAYVSDNKRFIVRTGLEVADFAAYDYDLLTGIFVNLDKMITKKTMLRLNTSVSTETINFYSAQYTIFPERVSALRIQPEIIHTSGLFAGADFKSLSGARRVALKFGYRFAINSLGNKNK